MTTKNLEVVIVDDEPLALDRLQRLVIDLPDWDVGGVCGSGEQAIELVKRLNPAVVLLDIRMPGMTGIEAARHMAYLPTPPAVIFVTAYDEYAIEAFDAQAVGYLLKPVRRDKLERALQHAQRLTSAKIGEIDPAGRGLLRRQNIAVRVRDELRLIPVKGIRFFRADQKYVTVSHAGGENLIDESLKLLSDEFEPDFVRIHRAFLVAVDAIDAIERDGDGRHTARLRDCVDTLPISRRRLATLKQVLEARGA